MGVACLLPVKVKMHVRVVDTYTMFGCLSSAPITVGYDPDSYVTSESTGQLNLTIRVFSHPMTGAPRPFTLVVDTEDGTASMLT